MSITHDGQRVHCDGEDCSAEACLPVALRPMLSRTEQTAPSRIDGWLFAADRTGWSHYCPDCIPQYLGRFTDLTEEQGSRESKLAP